MTGWQPQSVEEQTHFARVTHKLLVKDDPVLLETDFLERAEEAVVGAASEVGTTAALKKWQNKQPSAEEERARRAKHYLRGDERTEAQRC